MVKRTKCTFKECQTASQRIVGDCGFCKGHFCSKHRLLEDHKCAGLEDVCIPVADCVARTLACSSSSSATSSSCLSCSPEVRENGGATVTAADRDGNIQWWLVGLCDSLGSDEVADMMGSSSRARPNNNSAGSNHTNATLPSSRASAPKSSRVFDEDYEMYDE